MRLQRGRSRADTDSVNRDVRQAEPSDASRIEVDDPGRETARIDGEREALAAGLGDVRESFARWNRDPGAVVRVWLGTSMLVGIALLLATWLLSLRIDPDTVEAIRTFDHLDPRSDAIHLVRRNSLVLLMHALICFAGYMALTSMPIVAQGYTGWKRTLHLAAGPIAIVFVTSMTISSFALQAWTLGNAAPAIASAYGMGTAQLLALVSVHALPELAAVFLPLGAWLVLARRRAYEDLLAGSVFSTAVAIPLLVIAAITEVWVTPRLLELVAG